MATQPAYKPASRHAHGGYVVRSTTYPVGAIRPNRNAAGMGFTNSRRGRVPENQDTLRLSIQGTLDSLRGLHFFTVRHPCPCCGSKAGGKIGLNDAGKRRLRRLLERRAARLEG